MLTCPYSFTFQSPVALQQLQVAPMLIYNIFDSVCQPSNPPNMTHSLDMLCVCTHFLSPWKCGHRNYLL